MALIDILELPMRYTEDDIVLNTLIAPFRKSQTDTEFPPFGRTIPLRPFRTGIYWKYKTIEDTQGMLMEKIFLTKDKLNLDKEWWQSSMIGYPIQCKVIADDNAVFGFTYRYVNGIRAVLEDLLHDKICYITAFRNLKASYERLAKSPYSLIVPGIDADMLAPAYVLDERLKLPATDPWLIGPGKIRDLFQAHNIRQSYWTGPEFNYLINLPFEEEDINVQTDFIDRSFETYRLIEVLNHLSVTDITIVVNWDGKYKVDFRSRYGGLGDYKFFPETKYAKQTLAMAALMFAKSRFGTVGWKSMKIEKYWTEEIAVTLRASIEESSRDIDIPMFYLDIPVFLLGTVGLY